MNVIEKAKLQRANIVKAMQNLDDKDASATPELFDGLTESGSLIEAGTRINWKGALKRAAVNLWDTRDNNPDNAPYLWEDIEYKEGYRIIPDSITYGTMFSKDEYGWWNGELYQSLIDYNVYTPEQYAGGWMKV